MQSFQKRTKFVFTAVTTDKILAFRGNSIFLWNNESLALVNFQHFCKF